MGQLEWNPAVAQTLETAPDTSGALSLVRLADGAYALLRHGRPIPVVFSDERECRSAFEHLVATETSSTPRRRRR